MKRHLGFVVLLMIVAGLALGSQGLKNTDADETHSVPRANNKALEPQKVSGPKTVDVYLKRTYLAGESNVKIKPATIWSMEDFRSTYADWQAVDQDEDKVIYKKKIDDISPELKKNGYFGLSDDDRLKLYKRDSHGKKAVHSFFQINVKKLESGLYEKLQQGIPIQSKDHYKKVLSRLKPYSSQVQ